MSDNKEIIQKIEEVNEEIEKVKQNLIKALETVGIEYINLYEYINTVNNLKQLKQKYKTELILND